MTLTRYHIQKCARLGVLIITCSVLLHFFIGKNIPANNISKILPSHSSAVSFPAHTAKDVPRANEKIPEMWLQQIKHQIEIQEYFVSFDKVTNSFQSPNRKHNLRA